MMADLTALSNDELLKMFGDLSQSPSTSALDALPRTLSVAGIDTGIPIPQWLSAGIVGAGHGAQSLIEGAQQAFNKLPGREVQMTEQEARQRAAEQIWGKLAKTSTAANIGDVVGQVAPFIAAGPIAAAAAPEALSAAAAAHPFLTAAATGAAQGALPYTGEGQSTVGNAGWGAVGGIAGQTVGSGIGKLFSGPSNVLNAEQARLMQAARDAGYYVSPAQATGSAPLSFVESALKGLPGSGKQYADLVAGNAALRNSQALSTIGVPGSDAGPLALGPAKKTLGDIYESLKAMPETIPIDGAATKALSAIRDTEALKTAPDPGLTRVLDALLGKGGDENPALAGLSASARTQAIAQGVPETISGTAGKYGAELTQPEYQAVRSELADMSAQGGSVGNRAGQAKKALDAAMARALPEDAAKAWQDVNRRYAALKTIEPSVTPSGDIDPTKLLAAIKGNPAGRNALLYGEASNPLVGTLADIAKISKGLPQPATTSNTPQIEFWKHLLTSPTGIGLGSAAVLGGAAHQATEDPRAVAAGALVPFLLPRFAGKAYFSGPASRWAAQGVPAVGEWAARNPVLSRTLGELLTYGGAAESARAGQ